MAHFGECLIHGAEPDTPVLEAVRDIELVAAIVKEFLNYRGNT